MWACHGMSFAARSCQAKSIRSLLYVGPIVGAVLRGFMYTMLQVNDAALRRYEKLQAAPAAWTLQQL